MEKYELLRVHLQDSVLDLQGLTFCVEEHIHVHIHPIALIYQHKFFYLSLFFQPKRFFSKAQFPLYKEHSLLLKKKHLFILLMTCFLKKFYFILVVFIHVIKYHSLLFHFSFTAFLSIGCSKSSKVLWEASSSSRFNTTDFFFVFKLFKQATNFG